jgi:hypothetical protein
MCHNAITFVSHDDFAGDRERARWAEVRRRHRMQIRFQYWTGAEGLALSDFWQLAGVFALGKWG